MSLALPESVRNGIGRRSSGLRLSRKLTRTMLNLVESGQRVERQAVSEIEASIPEYWGNLPLPSLLFGIGHHARSHGRSCRPERLGQGDSNRLHRQGSSAVPLPTTWCSCAKTSASMARNEPCVPTRGTQRPSLTSSRALSQSGVPGPRSSLLARSPSVFLSTGQVTPTTFAWAKYLSLQRLSSAMH